MRTNSTNFFIGAALVCRGCAARIQCKPVNCALAFCASSCPSPYRPHSICNVGLTTVQVGKFSTHYTHTMSVHRGLLFCKKFGCRGPSKLVHLKEPCNPALDGSYVAANLSAIREGKLPQGLVQWPDAVEQPATDEFLREYPGVLKWFK